MTAEKEAHTASIRIGAKGALKKPFVDIDSILGTINKYYKM